MKNKYNYTKEDFERFVDLGNIYIADYKNVYQIVYISNYDSYELKLIYKYDGNLPLTKRGRHIITNKNNINSLLDFELLD